MSLAMSLPVIGPTARTLLAVLNLVLLAGFWPHLLRGVRVGFVICAAGMLFGQGAIVMAGIMVGVVASLYDLLWRRKAPNEDA